MRLRYPTTRATPCVLSPTPLPQPAFLALYERHADRHKAPGPSRQAKLKSAAQLQVGTHINNIMFLIV